MTINYFFFDYDNTLTANGHANELSRRLRDTINKNHTFVSANNEIVIETLHQNKDFHTEIVKSFGGLSRIKKLRNMFKSLSNNNKKAYICSTSWYPITALQWKTYLKYIMDYIKVPFKGEYILTLPVIPGSKESQKGKTIHNILVKNNVSYNEAIFYDDSLPNIQSAIGVCITRWLSLRKGMKNIDISDVIGYSGHSLIYNVSHFLIILICICICICIGVIYFSIK